MRIGRVTKLRAECEQAYIELHRALWPEVEVAIRSFGIRNYSIYLHDGTLFSYYELEPGVTPEQLAQRWEEDDACMRWETIVAEMQASPVEDPDARWIPMREIFHQD